MSKEMSTIRKGQELLAIHVQWARVSQPGRWMRLGILGRGKGTEWWDARACWGT